MVLFEIILVFKLISDVEVEMRLVVVEAVVVLVGAKVAVGGLK